MCNIFHFSVNKLFCTNLKILYLVIFQLSNTELFAILEKHEYSTLRLDSQHLLPSQLCTFYVILSPLVNFSVKSIVSLNCPPSH